jgi:hypothetical protein
MGLGEPVFDGSAHPEDVLDLFERSQMLGSLVFGFLTVTEDNRVHISQLHESAGHVRLCRGALA